MLFRTYNLRYLRSKVSFRVHNLRYGGKYFHNITFVFTAEIQEFRLSTVVTMITERRYNVNIYNLRWDYLSAL